MSEIEQSRLESVNKIALVLAFIAIVAVHVGYEREAPALRIGIAAFGGFTYLAAIAVFGRGYGSTHLRELLNVARGSALIVGLFLYNSIQRLAWVPWMALSIICVVLSYASVRILFSKPKALFVYTYLILVPLLLIDPRSF